MQLYETYRNSWRAYLVLEPAARGDLPEHINAVSDDCRCPGLEQRAHGLCRQLASAAAHCPNSGMAVEGAAQPTRPPHGESRLSSGPASPPLPHAGT